MPRLTTSKKSTGFWIVFCMYLSKAVMSKIRDAKFLYGYFSARSLKLKHVILQRTIQTERCSDICCSGGCCKLVFLFSIIKRIFDIFKKHQKKNQVYPYKPNLSYYIYFYLGVNDSGCKASWDRRFLFYTESTQRSRHKKW